MKQIILIEFPEAHKQWFLIGRLVFSAAWCAKKEPNVNLDSCLGFSGYVVMSPVCLIPCVVLAALTSRLRISYGRKSTFSKFLF